MVARISPEGESPPFPATSPKALSRQGTPAGSSETVYAVVSPNASEQVTTPAVTATITVTTLVILILFLLNCGKMNFIIVALLMALDSESGSLLKSVLALVAESQ